ncbi:hypothetical protein ACFLIN_03690 [Corynebacterium kutscheri]|uniref:hypothetical protein n=1 Tax=Corynebacterium kutscheri TaxID=35755 RepID=UPI0037C13A4B
MGVDVAVFTGVLTALVSGLCTLWGIRMKTRADAQAGEGDRMTHLESRIQDLEDRLDGERILRRTTEDSLAIEQAMVRDLRRVASQALATLEAFQRWLAAGAPPPPPVFDMSELRKVIQE